MRNRETAIQIRVSYEEKDHIEANAAKAGVGVSRFIRERAMGEPMPATQEIEVAEVRLVLKPNG